MLKSLRSLLFQLSFLMLKSIVFEVLEQFVMCFFVRWQMRKVLIVLNIILFFLVFFFKFGMLLRSYLSFEVEKQVLGMRLVFFFYYCFVFMFYFFNYFSCFFVLLDYCVVEWFIIFVLYKCCFVLVGNFYCCYLIWFYFSVLDGIFYCFELGVLYFFGIVFDLFWFWIVLGEFILVYFVDVVFFVEDYCFGGSCIFVKRKNEFFYL